MVWGMGVPSNFGEFWPDGNFEGLDKNGTDLWSERLRLHYLAQSPEEQRRLYDYGDKHVGFGAGYYASYVSGKFVQELGAPANPEGLLFSPVEPLEAPQFFLTEKNYQALGSLIALNYGVRAVDEKLKAIIERLEPGVHQFFPIEIRMPRGKLFPAKYHTMVIGRFLDSFSPENSKMESWGDYGPNYPNSYSYKASSAGISGLALAKARFGDAHLWRERSFTSALMCFSDALRTEIAKTGLRLPKHYSMKEV